MANIASLFQIPEAPQPASTVTDRLRDIEESGAQLLELRTENGAVYLCPSRWQRIRLQWTFRHFHVLSPQVLSRADQRLIEKLSQSAVVTPGISGGKQRYPGRGGEGAFEGAGFIQSCGHAETGIAGGAGIPGQACESADRQARNCRWF